MSEPLLLHARYWKSKAVSVVRDNLMNEEGYAPYCDCSGLHRMRWNPSIDQFSCSLGRCGNTKFPIGFIINYKRRWNK